MWTSQRRRQGPVSEAAAEVGIVTLGGETAGVSMGGERRGLPIYSPGGYAWRAAAGDKVLVLKAGGEGESPCILGTAQEGTDLNPGEVRLSGGSSAVYLGEGALDLVGRVSINGKELERYLREIVTQVLRELGG